MKNKQIKDFDIAFQKYLSENDSVLHKKAIQELLKGIDLKDAFDELLSKQDSVSSFFLMWQEAGKLEKNPVEKKGLKKLGKLSKKFYKKKAYKKLYELFFNLMLNNFAKFIDLENRDDFKEITDHDLYEKGIIPSEILPQYFLIEAPVKMKNFDWERNEDIMRQNLVCLIVCFGDIYEFFHEQNFQEPDAE